MGVLCKLWTIIYCVKGSSSQWSKESWGPQFRATVDNRVSASCTHPAISLHLLQFPSIYPSRLYGHLWDQHPYLLLRASLSPLWPVRSRRSCHVLMWSHLLATGDWSKLGTWPRTGQSESVPRTSLCQGFSNETWERRPRFADDSGSCRLLVFPTMQRMWSVVKKHEAALREKLSYRQQQTENPHRDWIPGSGYIWSLTVCQPLPHTDCSPPSHAVSFPATWASLSSISVTCPKPFPV